MELIEKIWLSYLSGLPVFIILLTVLAIASITLILLMATHKITKVMAILSCHGVLLNHGHILQV